MLSRLWYLVLALAVGGALAGAFLNKSAASREAEFQLEEQLRRDHVEAELWQRLDARLRLDALAGWRVATAAQGPNGAPRQLDGDARLVNTVLPPLSQGRVGDTSAVPPGADSG